MGNLLSSLPPRYSNCGQITLLLQALERELARLENTVQTVAEWGVISQADEAGIQRWEYDFGLSYRPDLTLESRKNVLLAALDRNCNGTADALCDYADRLAGCTGTRLQQNFGTYTTAFTIPQNTSLDFYSLQHWVRKRLPVHISSQLSRATDSVVVENS